MYDNDEYNYDEEQYGEKKKSNNIVVWVALILSIIGLIGLIALYFIYFFRNNNNNISYSTWNIITVYPDSAQSVGVATITPSINYVYVLAQGVTSVVLNTPTISNYGGTTFIIKVNPQLYTDCEDNCTIPITPPPGVNLQRVSIPPGGAVTFLWSNNTTTLYVV